jgi:hypothetical protein
MKITLIEPEKYIPAKFSHDKIIIKGIKFKIKQHFEGTASQCYGCYFDRCGNECPKNKMTLGMSLNESDKDFPNCKIKVDGDEDILIKFIPI